MGLSTRAPGPKVLLFGSLALATTPSLTASLIADDFTGGAGGVAPGWTPTLINDPGGTMDDVPGSSVLLGDSPSPAPAVFVHDILFDPTPGFVATAILPTGTSPLVEFFFGALSPGLDLAPGAPEPRMFLIALPDSSLRISAALGGVFDDEAIDDLFPGTFSWSPSDPIILTATPTGFSVSDSDDSTGTITYATAFDDSGLTLDSFGGAADFAIGALTSGSSPSPVTVDLDFVSLDGVAVPEASESLVLLLGVSCLLSGRRRKNRR